jgi:hypothetical protein
MQTITLDDVFASAEKYGEDKVLIADIKKVRDLKTINPKSVYDTTYIPLLFKHINGKEMKVKIKFSEQIVSSSAKLPHGSEEGSIPKNLNLSFMKMGIEDIKGGDYVSKVKDSDEDQLKEDTRVNNNIERYHSNSLKYLNMLDIIDKSYTQVCNELKTNMKTYKFKIQKDRKVTDIPIFHIKQDVRYNKETETDEKLANPIYRLKIPVCKKDGRLGIWSNYDNEFKATVFDTRKMTKKNRYQQVPAKVKIGGKMRELDVHNAGSFITYKSLIGGHIVFECIVASKFGLSLNNSFYDLYVHRHRAKSAQTSMSIEEIVQMRGGISENEESESDSEVEDEKNKENSDADVENPKIEKIHDSDDDEKEKDEEDEEDEEEDE